MIACLPKSRLLLLVLPLSVLLGLAPAASARQVPFAPPSQIAASPGFGYEDMALVDIDRDGDLDALSQIRSQVVWYENVGGSGASWTPHPITIADDAIPLVPADVDRDGDIDVVWLDIAQDLSNPWKGGVMWSSNDDGRGLSWTTRAIDEGQDYAFELAVADLDGDGDVDVAVGTDWYEGSTPVYWYENYSGGASWIRHDLSESIPHSIRGLAAGDFDRDGDMDLVSAESWYENYPNQEDRLRSYRNAAGDGSVWVASTFDTYLSGPFWKELQAGDLDGDGRLDFAASIDDDEDSLDYYLGSGAGLSFEPRIGEALGASVQRGFGLCLDDLDRDADTDLVFSAWDFPGLYWFEGASGSEYWPERTVGSCSDDAASGDLDGDGDVDLIAGTCSETLVWYENEDLHRSAPLWIMPSLTTSADGARHAVSADFDKDGDLDLALAAENGDTVSWFENVARAGTVWTEHLMTTVPDRPSALAPADVNGDGRLDLIVASAGNDRIAWYRNNDGSGPGNELASRLVTTYPDEVQSIAAADIDLDGDTDIVAAYFGGVAWWENQNADEPSAVWPWHPIGSLLGGSSVQLADVNRDGRLDVVVASAGNDSVTWWQQVFIYPSTLVWAAHSVSIAADGVESVAAGDVDHDGDLDLVAAVHNAGTVVWWENLDGAGAFGAPHTISSSPLCASGVALSDIDFDGDLDVAGSSACDDRVAWYQNTAGDGSSWSRQVIWDRADGASSVGMADLDTDGDPDVFSTSAADDTLNWFQNRGGQLALATTSTAPSTILDNLSDDVLRIIATHRGRAGDRDAELSQVALFFQDGSGTPLTSSQANALIDDVAIFRDTGSGAFEVALDTLVRSFHTLSLGSGSAAFSLPDGTAAVRVAVGAPQTYFVVVNLTSTAGAQTPVSFRVGHTPSQGSAGENRDFDTPLLLEWAADVRTAAITALRDTDADQRPDATDNCPAVANPDQADGDGDGVGNACDNCAAISNPDQLNSDGDAQGNACDNCPAVTNSDQADSDGDGRGNACDNCVLVSNASQADSDSDGRGNACDNCVGVANPNQANADGDARGDVCDNCPSTRNDDQADRDKDAAGDVCDNCPFAPNPGQEDVGGIGTRSLPDGIGNACQCGDVSGDGRITLSDPVLVTRSLLVPPTATLTSPKLCDVGGSVGCSLADAVILRRALLVPPMATIKPQCEPAHP